MKLQLPAATLRDALSSMAHIPGGHAASPFTQAVRFDAGMEGLILTRFTVEARISLTLTGDVEIEEDGTAIVDHAALLGIATKVPGKTLSIHHSDKNEMHISSDPTMVILKGYGDEADAEPPEAELETETITLAIEELDAALKFCLPSVCRNDARPNLCGIAFVNIEKELYIIGTTGVRMHAAVLPYNAPVNCLVPNSGIEAIHKAVEGQKGVCSLSFGDRAVYVNSTGIEIMVGLSTEKLPSLTVLFDRIESSKNTKIVFNADQLSSALKTCSAFTDGDLRFVPMQITKDRIKLVADNHRDTNLQTSLPCEAMENDLLSVPSVQLAQTIDLLPKQDGKLTMWHDRKAVFFYQKPEGRIAFIATGQPAKPSE